MEEEAIREKRRKKILERLQKESGNFDDSFEAIAEEDISKQKQDGLSAHEKYLILKNSDKKEVIFLFLKKNNFFFHYIAKSQILHFYSGDFFRHSFKLFHYE